MPCRHRPLVLCQPQHSKVPLNLDRQAPHRLQQTRERVRRTVQAVLILARIKHNREATAGLVSIAVQRRDERTNKHSQILHHYQPQVWAVQHRTSEPDQHPKPFPGAHVTTLRLLFNGRYPRIPKWQIRGEVVVAEQYLSLVCLPLRTLYRLRHAKARPRHTRTELGKTIPQKIKQTSVPEQTNKCPIKHKLMERKWQVFDQNAFRSPPSGAQCNVYCSCNLYENA